MATVFMVPTPIFLKVSVIRVCSVVSRFEVIDGCLGEFKNGKWHGKGTMNYLGGGLFEGEWTDGSRSFGTFTSVHGIVLHG